jgi:hypothetical protein
MIAGKYDAHDDAVRYPADPHPEVRVLDPDRLAPTDFGAGPSVRRRKDRQDGADRIEVGHGKAVRFVFTISYPVASGLEGSIHV